MQLVETTTAEAFFSTILVLVLAVGVVYSVVFMNEAIRKIPVYYARRVKGNKMYQQASNYLPLKLNQAGVVPIIFALSFVLFPQMIGNFIVTSNNGVLASVGKFIVTFLNPTGFVYNSLYFLLVVGFTFFYTIIIFNPEKLSEQIQRNGGFIPGIRPGTATTGYLTSVLNRLTSVGAVFLGVIAVLPAIASAVTGITQIIVGGTSILILVSVVLETFKLMESQIAMKNYDSLTRKY